MVTDGESEGLGNKVSLQKRVGSKQLVDKWQQMVESEDLGNKVSLQRRVASTQLVDKW